MPGERKEADNNEFVPFGSYLKAWPIVGFGEWCGEFKGEDYEKGED